MKSIVAVVAMLVLAIGAWWILDRIERAVGSRLIDAVSTSSGGHLEMTINDVDLRWWKAGLTLDGVRLTGDSLDIRVGRLDVSRIGYWTWVRHDRIRIGSFRIDSLDVTLVRSARQAEAASDSGLVHRLHGWMRPVAGSVMVGEIDLGWGAVRGLKSVGGDVEWSVADVAIRMRKVGLDASNPSGFTLDASVGVAVWDHPNGLYRLELDQARVTSVERSVTVQGFGMIPLESREAFAVRHKRINRYEFSLESLRIEGLEMDSIWTSWGLRARHMALEKARLEVTHDKRAPPNPYRYRPLAHVLLMDLPFGVEIDTVDIRRSEILFAVRKADQPTAAPLTFDRLEARLTGMGPSGRMGMRATARVMGQGALEVDAVFRNGDRRGRHTLNGTFDSADFGDFNPILENLMAVRAKSGRLHRMEFEMALDDTSSTGWMTMDYENFQIHLLGERQRFKTYLANRFVVNRHHHGRKVVPQTLAFTRHEEKSIFHYWWMTLLSGIKETLGL